LTEEDKRFVHAVNNANVILIPRHEEQAAGSACTKLNQNSPRDQCVQKYVIKKQKEP